jgi:hypothetical protein
MTIHPKQREDLLLAPVAAEIDLNLRRLRDKSPREVEAELELELDRRASTADRHERALLVARQAVRNVELHGWSASITDDAWRLHLEGGSVSLDLGLSPGITAYIREGIQAKMP